MAMGFVTQVASAAMPTLITCASIWLNPCDELVLARALRNENTRRPGKLALAARYPRPVRRTGRPARRRPRGPSASSST